MTTTADTIDRFVASFNVQDLDDTMSFFADGAEYLPGDGKTHRGHAEIRAAFEPMFSGAFGLVTFDEHDRLIDEPARRAAIRWTCRLDLTAGPARGGNPLLRWFLLARYGKRISWEGTDIFHFDEEQRITGKYTYGGFRRPVMRKDVPAS
ncbi:YybH family protein [Umezawaea endophytica]|uniref:Nuclear transport factor 2 family protein n=1 Tax=Umezawaea endophytica TaxID=1654476 RepID=A0A9X2VIL8_9PSEU|nr:nuclear transport factor 2 family protein [Umezawaea endophytica]MCS7475733.1 nuclear transport factor 2 family protein [Umezawaea endophytica]